MASKKVYIDLAAVKSELAQIGVSNPDEVAQDINSKVKALISGYKERPSIAKEQYKSARPLYEVYPSIESIRLPQWVLFRLHEARVMGTSAQLIIFPDGAKYQINNPLNDLSASEWLSFSTSVFTTFYSTNGRDSYAHTVRKIHPSPKPPQLMKDVISFFTKEGDLVLDYFMGVGGSLLGAGLCNRKAVGIELNQLYIDAYKEAARDLHLPIFPTIQGDCLECLEDRLAIEKLTNKQEISLILIDPPYGDMMSREKTGGDIGIVVFIKDLQPKKKETNLLHAKIVDLINEIPNIQYKGLRIWADKSAKLYPYGYPLAFVANQIHQFILVFRKEN